MNDQSDAQLLREYAGNGSEAAFREIVTRHADFVYSAALRQVESSAAAGDLAQTVFTDLARKANSLTARLTGDSSLAGWLHRSTRYAALNHLRDTRRRTANERQAMEQLLTNAGSPVDWDQIRPALDEALDSLADEDREALLLRYFKNQDFRAVGLALGVSDDTAQKRVSRAVDRLREFFAQRGVTVGGGGLVVLISANAVQSAPAGLAAAIATAALAGTAVTTTAVIAATTKTIAMTTLQKTLVTATIAVLAGAGIYQARQVAQLRDQNQSLQQQLSPLAAQIQQFDDATNRLAGLLADNSLLKSNPNQDELLKLRGEVSVLRNQIKNQADETDKNAQASGPGLTDMLSAQTKFIQDNDQRVTSATMIDTSIRSCAYGKTGKLPADFTQITNTDIYPASFWSGIDLSSFELLNTGADVFIHDSHGTTVNPDMADKLVVLREKVARQAPDGKWYRIYAFFNNQVVSPASSDGNFDAWEKANTYSPPLDQ